MISFCDWRMSSVGRVGDHSCEIERRADLLVVVPAGEVEHGDFHAIELVLVALGFPPVVEPGVLEHLAPVGERPADRFIHGQERQVAMDLVPGDGIEVLEHVAGCEVVPGDVHRNRHAGGPLDEGVGGSDHGDHRGQVRRLLDGGQPLVLAGIRPAHRGDLAGRPGLGAAPFDGVVAVAALVAVGHEGAARIAPAAHVGDDEDIAPGGEVAAAFQAFLVARRFQVGCAREDDGEPAVGVGAVDVGRERDAVAHRECGGRIRSLPGGSASRLWIAVVGPDGCRACDRQAADMRSGADEV